jgi:hypothetical protein
MASTLGLILQVLEHISTRGAHSNTPPGNATIHICCSTLGQRILRATGPVNLVVTHPSRRHVSGQKQTDAPTCGPTTPAPQPARRPPDPHAQLSLISPTASGSTQPPQYRWAISLSQLVTTSPSVPRPVAEDMV